MSTDARTMPNSQCALAINQAFSQIVGLKVDGGTMNIRNATAWSLVLVTAGGLTLPVFADPLERYAELQSVGEAINDPDPLMRLALLEEIIAKGDATEVQLAIRTAFTIDDPNIRSLALRAHFASFRTVVITAEYPAEIQAAIEAGGDELKASNQRYQNHFEFMDVLGGAFTFQTDYDGSSPEFAVYSLNGVTEISDRYAGHGNIKGALITIQSGTRLDRYTDAYNCTFEFFEYSGFTINGTGSCDHEETLPFRVTLHLFEPDEPTN